MSARLKEGGVLLYGGRKEEGNILCIYGSPVLDFRNGIVEIEIYLKVYQYY
jgi:hypothetical protein